MCGAVKQLAKCKSINLLRSANWVQPCKQLIQTGASVLIKSGINKLIRDCLKFIQIFPCTLISSRIQGTQVYESMFWKSR